jgi:hypothetical protein
VAGLRPAAATLLIVGSMALTGCATTQNPDPLEPWNRKVFAFNEVVDNAVLKPVATTYRDVVPRRCARGCDQLLRQQCAGRLVGGEPGAAGQVPRWGFRHAAFRHQHGVSVCWA